MWLMPMYFVRVYPSTSVGLKIGSLQKSSLLKKQSFVFYHERQRQDTDTRKLKM
jgi:hypothetical protein